MKSKRKLRLLIVLFILAGAAGAASLVFVAMGSNMNHFYEIKDIKSGKAPLNKQIRIGGMIAKNSLNRKGKTLNVNFIVTDFKQNLSVSYKGMLPSLFKEGQGVMATGKLVTKDKFVATEILAKHDENYMPSEVQKQLENSGMKINKTKK